MLAKGRCANQNLDPWAVARVDVERYVHNIHSHALNRQVGADR
ncbi:hypothetical protein ABZ814_19915 [Micromonospora musae]